MAKNFLRIKEKDIRSQSINIFSKLIIKVLGERICMKETRLNPIFLSSALGMPFNTIPVKRT